MNPVWLAISCLIGLDLGGGSALAADTAAQADIGRIEQAMTRARNADQSVKDYDPRIIVYDMTGNSMAGRDVVRDDFARLFAGMADAKVTILSLTIDSDARLAFAYSIQHLTARSTAGGPLTDIIFRQTDCLRKVAGRWRVVHQHISVPFDPGNGRAVFDSK